MIWYRDAAATVASVFPGLGTVINVAAILFGTALGWLLGQRFRQTTRQLVTQTVALFTLVIGGSLIASGLSTALSQAVGEQAPMLIVLAALLLGALAGSALHLERRLDRAADWLHRRVAAGADRSRFIEAAVSATLVFCMGPMAILGSLSDGLGKGIDQLLVKSVMDGFTAIAFAASLGLGVAASVVPLAVYQGILTVAGYGLGNFLSPGQVDALSATGGVILLGLALRLAEIKPVRIGDLLPALLFAPLLTWLVALFH